MKEYFKDTVDGRVRVKELDNGVVIEALVEPTAEFLTQSAPTAAELAELDMEGLDLEWAREKIKEIDELKARVEKLEASRL